MIPLPDQRALMLALSINVAVLALTLTLFALTQRQMKATRDWAISMGFFLAACLSFIHPDDPTHYWALLSSPTVAGGLIFAARGAANYVDRPMPWRRLMIEFAFWMATTVLFTVFVPMLKLRVICTTLAVDVIIAEILLIYWRQRKSAIGPAVWLMMTVYGAGFVVLTARLIAVLATALPNPAISVGNEINSWLFLGLMLLSALFGISLIWAVALRLNTDLTAANAKLQHDVLHDALTEVWNRRGALDHAERLMALRQRHERPFSVIVLDLDGFKTINDRYGHPAGDQVLKRFARFCETFLRAEDIIARVGGEEFLILLPETGVEAAMATAERLRAQTHTLTFRSDDGPYQISASFGVTEAQPDDASFDAVLRRADRALYRAKSEGRDRVLQG